MSCFILEKAHIDYMVCAALHGMPDRGLSWPHGSPVVTRCINPYANASERTPDQVGALLMRENQVSVHYRYSEPACPVPEYRYSPGTIVTIGRIDPVACLKAIDCYEYQSCEHDGWEASEARAFCDALRRKMINALPGYDAAPWGIDSLPIPRKAA